ncbi:MAG: hypothetical protein LBG23_04755 [Endomicrobium sp.]|jgi:hypothetical protein|nr:hypothetical protein [Endomicrobium sp.]
MEVGYSVGNNRLKVRSYVGVNTVVIRLKGYEEEGEYPLRLEVKLCIVRLGN